MNGFFFSHRWPRLYYLLLERPDINIDDNHCHQWAVFFRNRVEITAKVRAELVSMSAVYYPHGDPPLAVMDELISSHDFDFLEDVLLDLISCIKNK